METVLGLSITRSRVGWVLVEGQGADGAIRDRDEFSVGRPGGIRAVATAERAAAAVLHTRALADTHGHRLHAVGVTWSEDAAADAALLLEFLTEAGVDNVVPIRFLHAAEALACAVGPARLENALGITVIAHADAPLALARGAALASAPSAEFTGTRVIDASDNLVGSSEESRRVAYAGAVTMLVAGAVAFVVSLSLAVGLRLVPGNGPGERITDTSATPSITEAAVPARPPRAAPVRTAAKESRTLPDALPGGDRPDQTPPVPSP